MTPISRRLAFYKVTGQHPLHLRSTVAVRTPGTSPAGTPTGFLLSPAVGPGRPVPTSGRAA